MFRSLIIFFLSVILALALNSAAVRADENCAELVTTRCELCHYKTRICEKLGKKSKSSWKRTVKTMVRYGAKLSKGEQKQLIRCLSKPDAGISALCEGF